MKIEYLFFNLLIALASTIAVWLYPRADKPHLNTASKAITVVAIPFILVDMVVTDWFWSFNPSFITVVKIGPLPIEEILFFFTVPWACLLIWINLQRFDQKLVNLQPVGWSLKTVSAALSAYAWYHDQWYTMCILLILFGLSWLINWQQIKQIKVIFSVVVVFLTLIFNQYLTARPVVLYNPTTMLNFRVGTIPIEDFIYGLILVLSVVAVYERLKKEALAI